VRQYLKGFCAALFPACILLFSPEAFSQNEGSEQTTQEASYIHGDFQTDAQFYIYDKSIGTRYKEQIGNNSYLNLLYDRGNLSGGIRFENFQPVLLGYDKRLNGMGVPFRFVNYRWKDLSVTLGNFYEQFGNGLIYRSYWEWGLGFDNSIDGVRLRYNLKEGIQLKAFAGKQRLYFEKGPGIVRGIDAEFSLNELIPKYEFSPYRLSLGIGAVGKYQTDDDPSYRLPENVSAFSGRVKLNHNSFSLEGEYAWKSQDPGQTNSNNYRYGQALLLNGVYTAKGFGASLGLKRIDNFDFRSSRNANLNDLLINYLPPLTPQHTYRLATLYPYATQPQGEMGAQADIFWNAPEGSFLGGSTGTNFSINYSRINDIHRDSLQSGPIEANRFRSPFLQPGKKTLYQNLSVEMSKKLNSSMKLICSYIFIEASKQAVQGIDTKSDIFSHIGVVDLSWKYKPKHTLRWELQHLYTRQHYNSWAMFLMEYQIGSHYFAAIYDEYNYGNANKNERFHYPGATIGYTQGTVRISLSGGRQRAGVFCVGGVCRVVPASSGVSVSIMASF
jgi:hypothetical protein